MGDLLQPAAAWAKSRFRRLWGSRGGGYYGMVAALTFVYLEAVDLVGDVAGFRGVSLTLGTLISWFVSALVDAFVNGILAAIWPLHWLGEFGLGLQLLALLGGTYVTYRLVRPAVLRLLDTTDEELAAFSKKGARPGLEPPPG